MTNVVTSPSGFPAGIPIQQELYENWAQAINVPNMWTCQPRNEADVVAVCNWAAGAKWQVRARGVMHGWSPITIAPTATPGGNILLVDLKASLNSITVASATGGAPPLVTVQTGATMDALMSALQAAPGGQGSAPGYSFAHIPAPGNITVGGALAINAHGSAIRTPPIDDMNIPYGSLSNQILSFTAIVTEPGTTTYAARTFFRGEGDDKAFLAHLGRALLTSVTLQVTDNYNLRCQSHMDIDADTLFAAPTASNPVPQNSVAWFLQQAGRVEAIWFPAFPIFGHQRTSYPWFKVWTVAPQQPAGSTAVSAPYNYVFSDDLPSEVNDLIKQIFGGAAWVTPLFTYTFEQFSKAALNGGYGFKNTTDLWGPSMNTLLYVRDSTLRVTANGYAVQMKKSDVQQAIADFAAKFTSMLAAYQAKGEYPINSPLEIRVTNLDDPSKIVAPMGRTAQSPTISALTQDAVSTANGWDVAVWFDVLTAQPPGDPQHAGTFYQELEEWVTQRFAAGYRVMAEWSKGWAYTSAGAWTNSAYIAAIQEAFTAGRPADDNWQWESDTLAKYDAAGLFHAPLLDTLFPPTAAKTAEVPDAPQIAEPGGSTIQPLV